MENLTFLCGAAREDITPAVGTLLYGYNPHQLSTSVHDPLNVTAVAFRQGNDTVLLVTVTVGDFQTELSNEIRAEIGRDLCIPASRIIISATHTHSAPNVAGMEGWGGVDRPYVDQILFPAMRKCCLDAVKALTPAEFAVGEIQSQVGINRRQQNRDGSISLGQNPWGCYDPYMTCIAIRSSETKAGIINIIHYGCHGTAAGCNHEITRDWSGIMTDRLEAETGTLSAYWNGAQGDVGPRLTNGQTTGNIKYVEELGGVAASDAVRAYKVRGGYTSGSLSVLEGEVKIPYKKLPERDAVNAKLASYAAPDSLINIQKLEYAHYKAVYDVYEAGVPEHDEYYRFPQTIVIVGNAAFIPFPFEIFSEISLRMRTYAPVRYALCLSNTNGYNAYLPTEDQLVRGGYEADCFLYSGAYTLANNADQVLLDENLRIINDR
jgi:Neutral/alkaline non-lysosomal ceramidase.